MFSYDINNGWKEIEDFLNNTDDGDFSTELDIAGYSKTPSGRLGNEFVFFNTEIYVKDTSKNRKATSYGFIVLVDISDFCEIIAVTNVPSLIELLSKISTTSGTSLFSDIENEKLKNT